MNTSAERYDGIGFTCCNLFGQTYRRAIKNPIFAPFATTMAQQAFENCLKRVLVWSAGGVTNTNLTMPVSSSPGGIFYRAQLLP